MTPETRAAQLWCLPQFADRTMDVEFATAIADAIRAAVEEERAACAALVEAAADGCHGQRDRALALLDVLDEINARGANP